MGGFPTMEDLLKTRDDVGGAYTLFCDHFLQCVVRRRNWRAGIEDKEVQKVATVTDEALGLLLLENSWDKWVDMAVNRIGKSNMDSKYTGARVGKNSKNIWDGVKMD